MGITVFYALTRDSRPGTRVWFPGDLEEFEGCPKCKNEAVQHYDESWRYECSGCGVKGSKIEFCPFCGYELSKAVYKIQGVLKEWTGPQDAISPHKWAVVTLEDGTERKVSINRRGNGNPIS